MISEYIASELYKMCYDFDYMDYIDMKEEELKNLENAINWIEKEAKNGNKEAYLISYVLETITNV